MTLTKAALMDAAKQRFEWVEVEGFGRVGIRSVKPIQQSRREIAYSREEEELARSGLYQLIDQLMVSESQPMFTDADIEQLEELDAAKLDPLYAAIARFNGYESKKQSGESSDT